MTSTGWFRLGQVKPYNRLGADDSALFQTKCAIDIDLIDIIIDSVGTSFFVNTFDAGFKAPSNKQYNGYFTGYQICSVLDSPLSKASE